jgi:predicted nucleic acid-binding protein
MNVVVDANITVALFVNLPYSFQAERLFRLWHKQDVQLHVPALWPAEVVSTLRKMISVGQMESEDAMFALASLERMPLQVVLPDPGLLALSLVWAGKLNQTVAYDAQYIALAENLSAEFWTADQKMFDSLKHLNISWAHGLNELD